MSPLVFGQPKIGHNKFPDFELRKIKNVSPKKFYRKLWFKVVAAIFVIFFLVFGWFFYQTGATFDKVTGQQDSIWQILANIFPFGKTFFAKSPEEKSIFELANDPSTRINILVLGVRGRNDPNGGLLTDSVMLLSLKPATNQTALISIPRDLYVTLPYLGVSRKVNEVYQIGEGGEKGLSLPRDKSGGLRYSKIVFSEISGIPIHYVAVIDFRAFKEIVDALGGVTLNLSKPFSEPIPFEEGTITLPAGKQTIKGDKALLYVRARFSSSDFDRSRRQQEVLQAIKEKAFSTGTIFNPVKINALLQAIANNIRTDMTAEEIMEAIKIIQKMNNTKIIQKVYDTSDGLLYSKNINGMYVILPVDDNFDKFRQSIGNIFE